MSTVIYDKSTSGPTFKNQYAMDTEAICENTPHEFSAYGPLRSCMDAIRRQS